MVARRRPTRRPTRVAGRAPAILALAAILGCGQEPRPDEPDAPGPAEAADLAEPDETVDPELAARRQAVARLARWEDERRAAADFAAALPWSERSGPDPFALARLPDGTMLGLLRGAGQLVRLDARGIERARAAVATDVTGWTVHEHELLVVGPRSGRVQRFRMPSGVDDAPAPAGGFDVEGSVSLRSIAAGPRGQLALGDPYAHRVLLVEPAGVDEPAAPVWSAECGGPIDLRFTANRLLALCMLDHAVRAWRLDDAGRPTGGPAVVEHDGPIWSMDAQVLPGADEGSKTIRLVLGGVEDHPLDRSDGAFGYIDSFAFVVDLPARGEPVRRAMVNLSEHGAITPKWVRVGVDEVGTTTLRAIGFGGDALVTARWDAGFGPPQVTTRALVPGITDAWIDDDGSGMAADPLMDAWVTWSEDEPVAVVAVDEHDDRPVDLRLGEALALTGLMAQRGSSEGRRSRFTCETCHFEGGVDGRTHYTGRGQVHATTRPLRGLFPNRPHFSRALDRTMAKMVDNEFDVVSRGTEGEPWFSLSPQEHPWLRHLGVTEAVEPEAQRRALMTFLMAYDPEPNPAATADVDEAMLTEGVRLFEQHCERCHAARLTVDDPGSRVEPARWLALVAEGGPIVWGSAERMRTGVEPYVHEEGARVPSLRRLHQKRPYLTNGSAASLDEVLRRFSPADGMHDGGEEEPLSEEEQRALLAFLRRL